MQHLTRTRSGFLAAILALALCTSCFRSSTPSPGTPAAPAGQDLFSASDVVLRCLVIDDPGLAEAIDREWSARAERELMIEQATLDADLASLDEFAADVIIYPAALIGELVERQLIIPFPEQILEGNIYARQDVFELLRLREMRWGESTTMAVTFGSPQLVLAYRADLFEKRGLTPPRTWSQYQQIIEELRNTSGSTGTTSPPAEDEVNEEPMEPCAEPLAPGWGGQVLLARATAYARHRSQYSTLFDHTTMEPLIAGPAFIRALDELMAANREDAAALERTPRDVWQLLVAGRCAMALTWPAPSKASAAEPSQPVPEIAFTTLPGSEEVFNFRAKDWQPHATGSVEYVPLMAVDGRLGSVTRQSRQPVAAANLLAWLAGKEWSAQVATHSSHTTIYRNSQLTSPQSWVPSSLTPAAARSYVDAVEHSLSSSQWVFSPRIPGRAQYLAALDKAVQQALSGEQTSQAALSEAAVQWQAITEELGVASQQAAYRRSLGLDL